MFIFVGDCWLLLWVGTCCHGLVGGVSSHCHLSCAHPISCSGCSCGPLLLAFISVHVHGWSLVVTIGGFCR